MMIEIIKALGVALLQALGFAVALLAFVTLWCVAVYWLVGACFYAFTLATGL